jgi:hypothetical protein
MRYIAFILLAALLTNTTGLYGQAGNGNLFEKCKGMTGNDAVYLKDFVVKFPACQNKQNPPVSKNTVLLSKNIRYRFSMCSSEKLEGVGILQLYDEQKLLVSNLNPSTGKVYPMIEFICQKTGRYYVMISFMDGKAGEAVGIMSYVK